MSRITSTEMTTADVLPADLPAADLSENARVVLARRYLKKDEKGNVTEQPEEMFWRVARTLADVDASYGSEPEEVEATAREFYRLMAMRLFEPNSPTLMNAGRPLGQLSACFVLPVEDAIANGRNGIYDTLTSMARVHQSGGGTGFAFSRLRPEGDTVKSTMGAASGPVSFMKLYDASTNVVKQGGTRRGANMGILRVDHPDIRKFVTCKSNVEELTNFNISVAVTDAFMQAYYENRSYDLVSPRTGEVAGSENAKEIFDLIVEGAWGTGEPGIFFIDEANRFNPVPHLGSYEATNPCGEQPLLPYDVCNLGSINVGMFVKDGVIDWDALKSVVHTATHLLDNVIDANNYPLPEITDLAQRIRRIGLGIMGFADLCVKRGVRYNSEEGYALAREVMAFIDHESKMASADLAEERGVFPEWERSIWGPDATCARDDAGERIRPMIRLRNSNITTVAPTGTISIFADCSGGIEPLFAVAFMRNQAGMLMPDVNKEFTARLMEHYGDAAKVEAITQKAAELGHIHFDEVPEGIQHIFVTAHDVQPDEHVKMQAAFQKHTDSAISKTCNFSEHASRDDVKQVLLLAHQSRCKGVTVYRNNCRPNQVLSTGKKAEAAPAQTDETAELQAEVARLTTELRESEQRAAIKRRRPDTLRGLTRRMNSPLGDLYVTINEDENGRPFEVFMTLGKAGGAAMADAEAIGRLISLSLRSGVPLAEVRKELRGISCDRAVGFGPNKVLSVPDAIAQALAAYEQAKEGVQQELLPTPMPQPVAAMAEAPAFAASGGYDAGESYIGTCPDCASDLKYSEGCVKCLSCGYSECG